MKYLWRLYYKLNPVKASDNRLAGFSKVMKRHARINGLPSINIKLVKITNVEDLLGLPEVKQ